MADTGRWKRILRIMIAVLVIIAIIGVAVLVRSEYLRHRIS